jgi:hypothetical protein
MKILKSIAGIAALLSATCVVAEQDLKWVDLEKTDGAALFGEKCGMCHRGNGMGTAILARRLPAEQAQLESRTDLQAPFIETVVRSGFGVMYPISRGEVSDKQLTLIKQHLVKMQGGKK